MQKRDLIEALRDEGADLILEYGSTISGSTEPGDVDLFAVGLDDPGRTHFQLAEYDVIRLSWEEFNHYLEHLDPVYCTEAILSGQTRLDASDRLDPLRDQIQDATPSIQAVRHNVHQAGIHLSRAQQQPESGVIEALQFAASYWMFAAWYRHGREPLTLEALIEETVPPQTTRELLSANLPSVQSQGKQISIESAYQGFFELTMRVE